MYAGVDHGAIVATLALLQHFRAFLRSDCLEMRDPYELDTWRDGATRLTKLQAQAKLTFLILMAIARKGGDCLAINDSDRGAFRNHRGQPARKCSADYRRGLRQDANELNTPRLRIYSLRTPELRRRFAARIVDRGED